MTNLMLKPFRCEKYIKDGKVAIIHSNGFNGSGWYTLHGIYDLLFDRTLAEMINKPYNPDVLLDYCHRKYGLDHDFSGIRNLIITWLSEGEMFYFHVMDGQEILITWDQVKEVSIRA